MAIRPPEPTEEDIERVYQELWAPVLEDNGVRLREDLLKRELFDYTVLLENTSTVFDDLTWGRISKPNTLASEVIGVVRQIEEEERRRDAEELLRLLRREAGNLEDALRVVQEHFSIE